ncbi:MAG: hypothetical protein GY711_08080 [bacterium]|nr:hypothetical protein [bacterium]
MHFLQPVQAAALVAFATMGPALAAGVGDQLDVEFDDFTATAAKSIEDFSGRAILIEYFAYW